MSDDLQLPTKLLAMDARFPYMVVAAVGKEKSTHVYNLQGGPKPYKVSGRLFLQGGKAEEED